MRKLSSLVSMFLAVAFGLTVLIISALYLSGYLMMDGDFGDMGMMMGPGMLAAMFGPTVLVAVVIAAIVVVSFDLLIPKISPTRITEAAPVDYRDAVLRLLKDDERSLVEALTRSGGTAFQRDLQHAIGFSKVKTHRVIARLAERRLVEVTPAGKTNRIRVPSWLAGNVNSSNDHEHLAFADPSSAVTVGSNGTNPETTSLPLSKGLSMCNICTSAERQ